MKTHKIIFSAPNIAELVETELSEFASDNVLVEMEYTVVSGGTERACLMGMDNTSRKYPMSLGYCGVGQVIKTGNQVTGFRPGDRVLVYHGIHSSHNLAKENQLTKVENDFMPSIEAAFVIIASMSLGGVRKARLEIGESAMIMGQGILGIFATQLCRLNGAFPVIAADLNEDRRRLALEMGADYAFDPSDKNFLATVKSVTRDVGVDAVIEVTGASAALPVSLGCTARMGRISLLGCTRSSDCSIDYYQQIHRPGITLIGAHNLTRPVYESYPYHWTHHDDCRALLDLIAGKRIAVKPVISEIVSPGQAPEIYTRLIEDENFPVGVVFDWKKIN